MKRLLTSLLLMLSCCIFDQQQEISAQVTTTDVDYLIITSSSLADSFEDIVLWKNKKGVRTVLLTLDDIYSDYSGSTNQLKIKNCLKDYYDNHNLKFVMLGGDDSVVPVQYCYNECLGVSGIHPTDLFYMCLQGQIDWDLDGNGIVGEKDDGMSLIPDISLTRLPIRTASHVAAYTSKLLKYESNPARSGYVRRMLLAGKDSTNATVSKPLMTSQYMYQNYIAPNWTGGTNTINWLFDKYSSIPNTFLTPAGLISQLNTGYHFIDFNGHANKHIWGTNTTEFTNSNASSLTNQNTSIITTSSCNTNWFDDDSEKCISEAFLRNPNGGAVAYFGASRKTYLASDTTYLFSELFSIHFYDFLFHSACEYDDFCYGSVTSNVKRIIADDPQANLYTAKRRWHLFEYNAMGDAEMPIYTDNPSDFTNVSVSKSGTSVTVNTGGVSGCRIALTSTDGGDTYFDVEDDVSSYTFTNVNSPFYVSVTKHNYVPYINSDYQFLNTRIEGNPFIGSSRTYYVRNLPAGMTVEWSLSSTANCQVTNNSPSANQCTVTSSTSNYSVTLTATIKKDGIVQTTRTKLLTGGSSFTGTYEQVSCSDYGVTTPGISQTAIPSSHTMFVYQGCIVTLRSEYFRNKVLGTSGPYGNISFLGQNKILLSLSPWNVSQPLVLTVYEEAYQDEGIQFTFYAIPTSSLNGSYSLDITPMGERNYEVGLTRNEVYPEENGSENVYCEAVNANKGNENEDDNWTIEVYNVRSGRKVVQEELTEGNYLLNTTGWESGMYVVRAIVGKDVLVGKISVK